MEYIKNLIMIAIIFMGLADDLQALNNCSDEQIVEFMEIDHNCGYLNFSVITTKGELMKALVNPYAVENNGYFFIKINNEEYHIDSSFTDSYALSLISPEKYRQMQEKAEREKKFLAEVDELREAGIYGPFYHRDDETASGELVIDYTLDEIIALAEEIKAFRAKKQNASG